ncbi:MAG: LolA family protein [Candidatus Aminicenantia bacterium]
MSLIFLLILFQFQGLEKEFSNLRSFRAEFEQIYQYAGARDKLKEKGIVYFKKPSSFRWEYREPERKIFIIKGEELITKIPEEGIIQRERLQDDIFDIFSILMEGKISPFFETKEKSCPPDQCLILIPKESRDFNSIEVRFSKGDLKEIFIRFDYAENRIILKSIERNLYIPPVLFSLEDLK